jgi:hypothetical protein
MIAAADAILSYTNRGRSAFENDSTVRDAILYQIVVIGEAAKAVVAADETIAAEISSVVEFVGENARPNYASVLGDRSRDCVVHHHPRRSGVARELAQGADACLDRPPQLPGAGGSPYRGGMPPALFSMRSTVRLSD